MFVLQASCPYKNSKWPTIEGSLPSRIINLDIIYVGYGNINNLPTDAILNGIKPRNANDA